MVRAHSRKQRRSTSSPKSKLPLGAYHHYPYIPLPSSQQSHATATMPQDMPPAGGYEPVQYRRNLPIRGFKPRYYLLAVAGIMTYGFWKVGKGIREHK